MGECTRVHTERVEGEGGERLGGVGGGIEVSWCERRPRRLTRSVLWQWESGHR